MNDPRLSTATSTALLLGMRQGSGTAEWDAFVRRYRPVVLGCARKAGLTPDDAEDATQQTLAEFFRRFSAGDYERDRGRLRDWLFGIARNQIQNRRRQTAREGRDGHANGTQNVPVEEDRLRELWHAEWRDAVLRTCTERVSAEVEQRTYEAFILFAVRGLDAAEVASRLGISANAVFLAKRRVLGRMRELMSQLDEEI